MTSMGDVLEYLSDPRTAWTSFRDMRFWRSNHFANAETFILSSSLEALLNNSLLASDGGGLLTGSLADPGRADDGLALLGLLRAGALDGRRRDRTALVAEPAALTIWTLGLIPICLFVRLSMSCGGGSCEGAPKVGFSGAWCRCSDAHMSWRSDAATSAGASFL